VALQGATGFSGSKTHNQSDTGDWITHNVSGSFGGDFSLVSGSFEIAMHQNGMKSFETLKLAINGLPCKGTPSANNGLNCGASGAQLRAGGYISSYTYTVTDMSGKVLSTATTLTDPDWGISLFFGFAYTQ
jgi:hypothetical protein